MSIEVFNRYEKKFIMDHETYETLRKALTSHMVPDEYSKRNGFYTISNIYYDTPEDELILKSLEKPLYKEKLRLRAYGVPKLDDKVFLEIKKKYKGLVNKRRSTLILDEAYDFIASRQLPEKRSHQNRQVLKEIAFLMSRYDVQPSIYVAYDRIALFGEDLRITFDRNIRTRMTDLHLESGDHGRLILPKDQWLMEVKAEKTLPIWFVRLLSDNKLYPTSFSKVGKAYLTRDQETHHIIHKGEIVSCLNPYSLQQPVAL